MCAYLHFFSGIYGDKHLHLSNFLLPTYIFAAPSQIGLSRWRYYCNFSFIVTNETSGILYNVLNELPERLILT